MEASESAILACGVGFFLYIFYENSIAPAIEAVDWIRVLKIIIIFISIVALLFIFIYCIYKIRQRKKSERQNVELYWDYQRVNLFSLFDDFSEGSSSEMKESLAEVKKNINKQNKEVLLKYDKDIKKFYERAEKAIISKQKQEHNRYLAEQEIILEEENEKRLFQNEVNELYEFKKSRNSLDALPLDKKYSDMVIRKALDKLETDRVRRNWINRIKQKAIDYYQSNGLDTKPNIGWDEEPIFTEIREAIKEGKLNISKVSPVEEQDNNEPKLQSNFYRSKDLDDEAKKRALKQGFKHIRGIELDGSLSGGGFYIKKRGDNESDYHFYMKHLFAELDSKMKIEYGLEGKRVDIAFISNKLRLGIEIETNTNKDKQLAAKIPWLNKNFDKWIFVCSRDDLKRYEKLVDWNKSFCFTTKKSREKVLELITT